jgi:hypothetical protein
MHELELFDANPDWRIVLQAYADRRTETAWVPRIESIPDFDPALLSPVHGKLIALGLLKFDLDGKSGGIQYQLTPLGRNALLAPGERPILNEWQQADEAA